MILDNFRTIFIIYLAVTCLAFFLSIIYRDTFWRVFSRVFPALLGTLIIVNLFLLPYINQRSIHPSYQGQLQRLPSNELIDLLGHSASPARLSWIYPLVEEYYLGRTLLIPENVLGSVDLSPDRLVSQGRLADVKTIKGDLDLSGREAQRILGLASVALTTKSGEIFYFVTEDSDPGAPLLLLRYEQQLFFLPEDLLAEIEEAL